MVLEHFGSRRAKLLLFMVITISLLVVLLVFVPHTVEVKGVGHNSFLRDLTSDGNESAATTLLCAGSMRPRVAVVISGAVRTFIQPYMWKAIQENVIKSFGGDSYVFFNIHMNEVNSDKKEWVEGQINDLIAVFKPVHVSDLNPTPYPYEPNEKCIFNPGVPMEWADCDISPVCNAKLTYHQYGPLYEIWKDILAFEIAQGAKFDYIMRVRTDVLMFQSLPPFCMFDPTWNAIYHTAFDHFNLMSRSAAPVVFELLPRLLACDRARPDVYNVESLLDLDGQAAGVKMIRTDFGGGVIARPPLSFMDTERPALLEDCDKVAVLNLIGADKCRKVIYMNPSNAMESLQLYKDVLAQAGKTLESEEELEKRVEEEVKSESSDV